MTNSYSMIAQMAAQRGIDPALAQAVLHQESRGNASAVSRVGARGLMQTMPGTLTDPGFGVRPAKNGSPEELARVGVDYLRAMLDRYNNDIPTALAAYNAGPGRADKYGANVPFEETRNYVKNIMSDYRKRQQYADNSQYAGAMTDVKHPSLADFAASRRAQPQPQPQPQAGSPPSLADFAASRRAQRQAQAPLPGQNKPSEYNMNPVAKRNAAATSVTPAKVDAGTAFGAGIVRGLADVGAGLVKANDMIAGINPLSLAVDYVTGGATSKPREQVSAAVDQWNRDSNKAFAAKYGDSTSADVGRFTGNAIPMLVPGAMGVRASTMPGMIGNAAVTGAAQNAIIGAGRNPDGSMQQDAATGALFGMGGSVLGRSIGSAMSRMAGKAGSAPQAASNTAIKKLLDASAPNLDDMTAASRLQAAIRQGNQTLVEGASPTTAQAAMLPGISQVRRDVVNYSPANVLVDKEALQEQARIAALGGISDVSGLTAQDAAQAAGQQARSQIIAAHQAAKAATSELYESPALQSAIVPTAGAKAAQIYDDAFVVGGRSIAGDPTLKAAADVLAVGADLPFGEINRLRSLVGGVASDYNKDAVTRRAATQMVKDIDGMLESLPEFATARAARAEQGRLYESGIVGDITGRKGSGDYLLSEEGITRRMLSTAPGQTVRMQEFKRAADPQSMDALKNAFMADLLERSGRNLGTPAETLLPSQLSGYTNKRSGMMRELFTPEELSIVSGVTQDAQRAAAAETLGKAVGSNTAQNIHGALNLGLMDSPMLNRVGSIGGKVPLIGDAAAAAVDGIKQSARTRLANDLAALLADPKVTDDAITAYIKSLRAGQVGGQAGLLAVPAQQGLLD